MFPPAAGCRKNRSGYRKIPRIHGPVVQLVRTLACHARGQGFESPSGRHLEKTALAVYASVAQLVEQGTENPRVVGSIPTGGTIYADLAHLVERDLAKVEVAGSSPVIRSKQNPLSKEGGFLFVLFTIHHSSFIIHLSHADFE